jgi:MinD-like ATPase involved in chromosome partitioning or flagellar assembly
MMSSDDVRRMENTLSTAFPSPAHIQVVADPFAGARILIISPIFATRAPTERRELVLSHIDDDQVARLELLTPEEHAFLGARDLEVSADLDNLPLWPEALAHGEAEQIVLHLPSQTFTSLIPPVVATFYSLRGGVGRSTTLAHVARVLAGQGLTVLCVDMDLEAPGLSSLFAVEDQVTDGKGVVPLLLQTEISGTVPDISEHVLRVTDDAELYLLPAGLPNANYARQLALLDPSAWYREEINPLRLLIDAVRELPKLPDVVLIDSRTGISPLAAPLLFDVADINIVAFYPHPQARIGTRALTRALIAAHSQRSTTEKPITPELRFVISPVPATPDIRSLYAERAQKWIGEWLAAARDTNGERVFNALEDIIQVVSYQETIATSDSVMSVDQTSDFDVVAAWVAGLVESTDAALSTNADEAGEPPKSQVLASLSFAGETAEDQDQEKLIDTFLNTADVNKALSPDTPVVIGRKGTGKTAIFRKLATEVGSVVVTSPPVLNTNRPWTPDADFYGGLAKELGQRQMEWRQAWPAIISLAILQYIPDTPRPHWLNPSIGKASNKSNYLKTDLLRDLRTILEHPDASLLTGEWLQQIDRGLTSSHLLLFDGLDTGFGNTDADRRRRNDGVAGLLTTAGLMAPQFVNLKFKILLREDIWREVAVPNKSHLDARSARLKWSNQADYLRIAIKQAWRSEPFKKLVSKRLSRKDFSLTETLIDYWPEEFVRDAWVILAGERVSGGNTAYTSNWIWSRLSDGNGDHSPRALAQLLTAATSRERDFEHSNPYTKSIIRPRALVESLDDVSELALDALSKDEFPELRSVFEALKSIGSTPFPTNQLTTPANLTTLAREVGLLETVGGLRDGTDKLRVPELYRKALEMTRRGQA